MRKCSVKDCNKKHLSKGLCGMHYARLKRHGTLDKLAPPKQRLEKRIIKKDKGCWIWTGGKSVGGYGVFTLTKEGKKKQFYVHRLIFEIYNNTRVDDGLCICHKCDNPLCVNPEHLFLGTAKDNMIDMTLKDRGGNQFGKQVPTEDCIKMKGLYKNGFSQNEIAKMFGIRQSTVWKKVHSKLYNRVGLNAYFK